MTLNCWSRGATIGFAVEISSTKTVAALKEVIANKKLAQLVLYKVSLPYGEDDSLKDVLWRSYRLQSGKTFAEFTEVVGYFCATACRRPNPPHHCVDDLKDAIKVAYHGGDLENVTPDRLKLYKISANEEAELREHLCSLGSGRLLQGHEWVERVFDDVPFFQTPRVVIELDAKRDHPEDPFEANKRIRHKFATLPMQTPSMIAMPCYFQEHYEKNHEPHIRCGRPGENHSPFPLVLAHRIFVTFVSECETYEPNDEDPRLS
ncbi:hypothetical protein J3R82DRAFT_7420 [Butyriboletus roseoflavus]|nr:hypothetical protein J3R82DRAFT_7420 [Butyriboletus roseoflavus]